MTWHDITWHDTAWYSGTEKVPRRTFATKISPNFRVNFLVRFASTPLFYWVVPSTCSDNSLVLFVRFFRLGVLGRAPKYRTKGCSRYWRPRFTAMKWLKCCENQCSRSRAVSGWVWTPFCVILWGWLGSFLAPGILQYIIHTDRQHTHIHCPSLNSCTEPCCPCRSATRHTTWLVARTPAVELCMTLALSMPPQRALRDILMPRGKTWLLTVPRQFWLAITLPY